MSSINRLSLSILGGVCIKATLWVGRSLCGVIVQVLSELDAANFRKSSSHKFGIMVAETLQDVRAVVSWMRFAKLYHYRRKRSDCLSMWLFVPPSVHPSIIENSKFQRRTDT